MYHFAFYAGQGVGGGDELVPSSSVCGGGGEGVTADAVDRGEGSGAANGAPFPEPPATIVAAM